MKLTIAETKLQKWHEALRDIHKTTHVQLRVVSSVGYLKEAWRSNDIFCFGLNIKPAELKCESGDGSNPTSTNIHLFNRTDFISVLKEIRAKCVEKSLTPDIEICDELKDNDGNLITDYVGFTIKSTTYTWYLKRILYLPSEFTHPLYSNA